MHFLVQPERGVLGLAEAVHIPTAAAIANAVHNAIGVPVMELPMTPARVLASARRRSPEITNFPAPL